MITDSDTENDGIEDLSLFREMGRKRSNGELSDTDRVSLPTPGDTVRLHSAFGYGATVEMFSGICKANFIALNPQVGDAAWK